MKDQHELSCSDLGNKNIKWESVTGLERVWRQQLCSGTTFKIFDYVLRFCARNLVVCPDVQSSSISFGIGHLAGGERLCELRKVKRGETVHLKKWRKRE